MIIALEFDGVIVREDDHDFDDTDTPLTLMPGALVGLRSLRSAGHVLLLYSERANRALRENPALDPLVVRGIRRVDPVVWAQEQPVYQARYEQMVSFASGQLRGLFQGVDDGSQGKPVVDLFIDRRVFGYRSTDGWMKLKSLYGAHARRREE